MRDSPRPERVSKRVDKRVARRRQLAVGVVTMTILVTAIAMVGSALGGAVATRRPGAGAAGAGGTRQPPALDASSAKPEPPKWLATPGPLRLFQPSATPGEGDWHPMGRLVDNRPAVYETTIGLPGQPGTVAGVAWMDTRLLSARLYSGSQSPGGYFWKYTAPVTSAASKTLVAAFNGGFLLNNSNGGYLSEGHLVAPLRNGAASLVIYNDGLATVGEWGRDVTMSPSVAAVRQNLTLLVDHGRPVPGLSATDISTWGYALYRNPATWRSGLGVTAHGDLVYVAGPMDVVDLAAVLVRAGAVRAMTLDMNPWWTVFATYSPLGASGPATPANGTDLLPTMAQGPGRFFQVSYARDFVTMSAR